MNGWYRAQLGELETQHEYALDITPVDDCWGKLRACMDHPQIIVRVAAWLGVIGVALGVIGVILGIIGILH